MGLKLCTRCGKAKYCDKTWFVLCRLIWTLSFDVLFNSQQFHWKEAHKKECRSPEILALEVSASLILVWNLPLAIVDV
ncbi:hypothetical protein SISNIDRAFT_452308 [Sistotremastrum niveocremeum HHB9708]|uniref:MYND-type domain-containing protein n=1 Tax=Sistotremastrum niveocremeum HHB9708 TaxID=1314777 RepID=A0A164X5H9_9AGAM|nr:hypothetical protein SISNIDRAFT_452308 [Sistotremastrum niveocremeum HHB9708]